MRVELLSSTAPAFASVRDYRDRASACSKLLLKRLDGTIQKKPH